MTADRVSGTESGREGLKGQIRITMNGAEALRWRQHALRSDEEDTKKAFDEELQEGSCGRSAGEDEPSAGAHRSGSYLMAVADVSGNMGTQTGKRILLAGIFCRPK